MTDYSLRKSERTKKITGLFFGGKRHARTEAKQMPCKSEGGCTSLEDRDEPQSHGNHRQTPRAVRGGRQRHRWASNSRILSFRGGVQYIRPQKVRTLLNKEWTFPPLTPTYGRRRLFPMYNISHTRLSRSEEEEEEGHGASLSHCQAKRRKGGGGEDTAAALTQYALAFPLFPSFLPFSLFCLRRSRQIKD